MAVDTAGESHAQKVVARPSKGDIDNSRTQVTSWIISTLDQRMRGMKVDN